MFHYVTDKVFLKESYSVCADTVNQLVQKLKSYGIQSSMSVVGSKKYDLITQNEKEPIDYDFNLWIESAENIMSDPKQLKCTIMEAFNEVLRHKGQGTCNDSTSALTTKKQVLDKKNKTPFSIDVCIVRSDSCGNWYRLIHSKTGYIQDDQYYWSMGLFVKELEEKENYLRHRHWMKVRKAYLEKKNMYLSRQELNNHSSYNCYIEAINEVYNKVSSKE